MKVLQTEQRTFPTASGVTATWHLFTQRERRRIARERQGKGELRAFHPYSWFLYSKIAQLPTKALEFWNRIEGVLTNVTTTRPVDTFFSVHWLTIWMMLMMIRLNPPPQKPKRVDFSYSRRMNGSRCWQGSDFVTEHWLIFQGVRVPTNRIRTRCNFWTLISNRNLPFTPSLATHRLGTWKVDRYRTQVRFNES